MQELEKLGMEAFDRDLSELLKEFPEMRRRLHKELAELAKKEVDAAISSSGLNDSRGNVRRWQVAHVGSGGGYAAVRAASEKEGGGTGPDSAGAVTNYLEGGHNIRPPSGAAGYRPRIRVVYVNGFHFYQTARSSFEATAVRLAERFADRLAQRLEGGG